MKTAGENVKEQFEFSVGNNWSWLLIVVAV